MSWHLTFAFSFGRPRMRAVVAPRAFFSTAPFSSIATPTWPARMARTSLPSASERGSLEERVRWRKHGGFNAAGPTQVYDLTSDSTYNS